MKVTIRMISLMCEGFIFLYLGLGLLSFGTVYDPIIIGCAIIAILVSRTHVFIICSLQRYLPGQQEIPLNQQTLMWFSGLRGAVAFALGVTFLEHPDFSNLVKGQIFGTTVMVVVMTIIIFGGLTPYMLKWLKITEDEEEERRAEEENAITEEDLEQPIFGWLYRLDAMYIRPHFSHNAKDHIQALKVIQRRESRIISRQASMMDPQVATRPSFHSISGFQTSVQSPLSLSSKKGEMVPLDEFDDQAKLINKSNQADEIALEAISLN
ncbi:hypothetical protein BASA62_007346 [Batrachochytrium salamandrivorans]|nr:hypothetical protein BASA62_007346 [Batrachochytrium salamandrivorans]